MNVLKKLTGLMICVCCVFILFRPSTKIKAETEDTIDYVYFFTDKDFNSTLNGVSGDGHKWEANKAAGGKLSGGNGYRLQADNAEIPGEYNLISPRSFENIVSLSIEYATNKTSGEGTATFFGYDKETSTKGSSLAKYTMKVVGDDGRTPKFPVVTLDNPFTGHLFFEIVISADSCYIGSITITCRVSSEIDEVNGDEVNFHYNDEIYSTHTRENKTIIQIEDPVKDGYVFGGWYQEGSNIAWNFANDHTTGETDLYAVWNKETNYGTELFFNFYDLVVETNTYKHEFTNGELNGIEFSYVAILDKTSCLQMNGQNKTVLKNIDPIESISYIIIDIAGSNKVKIYGSNEAISISGAEKSWVVESGEEIKPIISGNKYIYNFSSNDYSYFCLYYDVNNSESINSIKIYNDLDPENDTYKLGAQGSIVTDNKTDVRLVGQILNSLTTAESLYFNITLKGTENPEDPNTQIATTKAFKSLTGVTAGDANYYYPANGYSHFIALTIGNVPVFTVFEVYITDGTNKGTTKKITIQANGTPLVETIEGDN